MSREEIENPVEKTTIEYKEEVVRILARAEAKTRTSIDKTAVFNLQDKIGPLMSNTLLHDFKNEVERIVRVALRNTKTSIDQMAILGIQENIEKLSIFK